MATVDGASNLYGQLMEEHLELVDHKMNGVAHLLGRIERLPQQLPGLQRVEAQV